MKEKEYYTPELEEFHHGFKYEMKSRFGNGTIKTKEDFDNADWEEFICSSNTFPYLERILNGGNSKNLPPALRVKYLDKYDIEELGWEYSGMLDVDLHTFKLHIQSEPDTDIAKDYFHLRYEDYTQRILITDGKYEHYRFFGEIKNKSELMILMKQLGI